MAEGATDVCFVSSCSTPEKASPDKAVSDKEGEGK